MGVKYPIAASAMGGHFAYQDNFEWPNTFDGMLEFGPGPVAKNGFVLQYTMRMGSRRVRRSHAKCFYGTEATMVVDRSRISIAPEPKAEKIQTEAGYLLSEEEEILPADDKFRHSAGVPGKHPRAETAGNGRPDGPLRHQPRPPDEHLLASRPQHPLGRREGTGDRR